MLKKIITGTAAALLALGVVAVTPSIATAASSKIPSACSVERTQYPNTYSTAATCGTAAAGTQWKYSVVCPNGHTLATGWLAQGSTRGTLNCLGGFGAISGFSFR